MVLPQTNQALLTTGERKCEVRDIGVPRMVDPNTGMPYNNGVIIKVQTSKRSMRTREPGPNQVECLHMRVGHCVGFLRLRPACKLTLRTWFSTRNAQN